MIIFGKSLFYLAAFTARFPKLLVNMVLIKKCVKSLHLKCQIFCYFNGVQRMSKLLLHRKLPKRL